MPGRYCPNIKSLIYCNSIDSDEEVLSFFRTNGHKLEEALIYSDNTENLNFGKRIYYYDDIDFIEDEESEDSDVDEIPDYIDKNTLEYRDQNIIVNHNDNYKFYGFCPNIT